MNLEYEISWECDRDLQQANWEYSLKKVKIIFIPIGYLPIFISVASIGLIIWGLFDKDTYDSGLLIGYGLLGLIIGIILFFIYQPKMFLVSLNKKALQKQWSEYYSQRNKVNIILTPQEFILKTKDSEKACTWKTLKSLDEYSTGFIIKFFSGYSKFIPNSAFIDESQINKFKKLIEQYKNNY